MNNKTTYGDATWKYVDSRKEAADLFIMNHTAKGDITVTQDIGLTSVLLPKGVCTTNHSGLYMMNREYKLLLTCAIYMLKQEEGVYMV
ncbi:uncharacterized protein YaiI (UPF0178 family) [Neobacillus niacini]|nr:uncharacterized protein YaiI (UPF0178 family) [Neobacillus niacini]